MTLYQRAHFIILLESSLDLLTWKMAAKYVLGILKRLGRRKTKKEAGNRA